ncbi:hypothetical protein M153_100780001, partial [Pseudoloma neurophilia]
VFIINYRKIFFYKKTYLFSIVFKFFIFFQKSELFIKMKKRN